ncbi:TniQ family protein [Pararhodobacter oceanensis]|uniref:TniQ family protein n=1 Tax=Pararhodobacter oceanensis TaxID=2172121 RepID=UPI003A9083C4
MKLAPHILFDPAESPLSFAARLAKIHIGERLVPFLRDIDIDLGDMAANAEKALAQLAEVSGVAIEDLRFNVAVPLGERTYDLRGELVSAEFLASPHTVYCPACLAQDDRIGLRRGRWEWALSVVRTCPQHEIPLVRQAYANWDDKFHELDHRVPECGAKLAALVSKVPHRPVSPLQDYVMRRLDGNTGPKWLDAQTLDQAARGTELLGVLVAFGPAQNLPQLSPDDWDHAGRIGFNFTSRGEEGIREALEVQFSSFDTATGTPGARKIFGCFYNALAGSKSLKEPGDIARILRDVITERIALPAGHKVLGKKLAERRLHTVASLANEQGLNSVTLRSVLVAADVIPENAPSHFPIPVDEGREVAGRVKRTVHVISLPDFMNCARPLVDQLFSDRLLTPIYTGSPGIRGRTIKSVDEKEIAMLVGKLHTKAILTEAPLAGLVPISKAAEKAKVPAIIVLHLILGGFLDRVFRLASQEGVGALLVDSDEVKCQKDRVTMGLSSVEAFSPLKIAKEVGWRLVDQYQAITGLTVIEIFGPDRSHAIRRFDPDNVARFSATFTTPARLAEQHELQIGEVVRRLKRSGAQPVISKAEIGMDLYRVNALKPDFFL